MEEVRSKDVDLEEEEREFHGKRPKQKMKPYFVLRYLQKNTDENNTKSASEIIAYLECECGIKAERRSVYRDIDEINKAIIMLEQNVDMETATEILADDPGDEEKAIVYSKTRKGFYAKLRNYDIIDVRLLAECIYSAKFLEKSQADFLVDMVCGYVNERQAQTIKHDVLLTDRVRTNNSEALNSIATINEAMSKELDGEKHVPEKISFKYLKYTISDLKKQVARRKGESYVLSPYALLINDGNYYLLAFDSKKKKFVHYRIDRMSSVKRTGEKRDGEKEFLSVDLKSYTQRVFNMYGGEERRVTLRFINPLLDTVVDRFGTKGVQYTKCDERHFTVECKVQVSKQFFGWLFGLENQVKIISPDDVVEKFKSYIDKVQKMYE